MESKVCIICNTEKKVITFFTKNIEKVNTVILKEA